MSYGKPVEKCACGADCSWCVTSNKARAAFPSAKRPPLHDASTEHECQECFLKRPDLVMTSCNRKDTRR